jgi:hypothetical protein
MSYSFCSGTQLYELIFLMTSMMKTFTVNLLAGEPISTDGCICIVSRYGYFSWLFHAAAVVGLVACGGGDAPMTASLRRAQEAVAKPVTLKQLPELHQCLSGLSQQLKLGASRADLSLACMAGRFSGLTMQGDACFLQVDAQLQRFSFVFGNRHVDMDWADVAVGTDGRPVHNLESSDLGGRQPGVQLTRFTPVPDVVTEALALRAGQSKQGPLGLPQMTYLRVQGGQAEEIRCRFGT